jgi:hypothetical protein
MATTKQAPGIAPGACFVSFSASQTIGACELAATPANPRRDAKSSNASRNQSDCGRLRRDGCGSGICGNGCDRQQEKRMS